VKNFSIRTLGCKVNQYEEQVIREKLLSEGYKETSPANADIFIVNSCTVTAEADRKTLQLIRKAKRDNPGTRVIVTGCYAVQEEDIEKLRSMPEVDMVVEGKNKSRLHEVLSGAVVSPEKEHFDGSISAFAGHTRAFLKIQDGCDRRCAYCKVSLVRGPSVSRPYADILPEVKRLVSKGHREIVLTGICTGSWRGAGDTSLPDLVTSIDALQGNFRVRLSSLEPDQIDRKLIKALSSSKRFCRHLHVPLQSGSDGVLKAMRRRYTSGQFRDLVLMIRGEIPVAGISLDVIAGFPGESVADIEKTRDLLREIMPSRLHVFTYSKRPGTEASGMSGGVDGPEARKRAKTLIEDGRSFQVNFCKTFIDRDIEVLIEARGAGGTVEGYTGEYVRVRTDAAADISTGDLLRLKGTRVDQAGPFLIAV
jgi:threonylcarbamoyladenosine tRNA methylthiotransferase MtaB